MAKDYFHDIVPPAGRHSHTHAHDDDESTQVPIHRSHAESSSGRSIRNITAPSRHRTSRSGDEYTIPRAPRERKSMSRILMWSIAAIAILLLGALLVVALRPTRVTISPRTHVLNFSSESITAYPESTVGENALSYGVETVELEDSEVVPSQGTVYAEEKASGTLTVYNNHQTAPLKLVKNTRFETPSGLIFRTPADIVVPGKKGSTPGSIEVTVVADQPGEQYNVAAGKFTVPGLKSTPDMYKNVYAESSDAFTGGFVGERPGVPAGALESAIETVRTRLAAKAAESVKQIDASVVTFPSLVQIDYQSMPNTTEAGGSVRIHQKARVSIPTFPSLTFAYAVSGAAISSGDTSSVVLKPGSNFAATAVGTSTVLGVSPLSFALSGQAMLVWQVDQSEIQSALAGKDKSAFEAIVGGFPAVQEASARIEPFWNSTFPEDPQDIKITIKEPEMAQ